MKKKLLSLFAVAAVAFMASVGASAQLWILGEVDGNGESWAPNLGTAMTAEADGTYSATVVLSGKNSGYNYFSFTEKLAETASDWGSIASSRWGADSNDYPVDSHIGEAMVLKKGENAYKLSAGTYDLSVDLTAGTLTVTRQGDTPTPPEPQPVEALYVLGEVNGNSWAPNVGVEMASNGDRTFSATVTSDGHNSGYNYFSFSSKLAESADDWAAIADSRYGADAADKEVIIGEAMALQAGENAFKIGAGEFTLNVDLNAGTLTVNGDTPTPPEPSGVYILGNVNGNSWAPNVGTAMEFDGKDYFATVTVDNASEGYGFFGFSTQLGESAEDWDAIAPYRFGAPRSGEEENFLVTADMLGNPISLTNDNYIAFQLAAAEYTLTVSSDLSSLVITKNGDTPSDDNVFVLGTVNGAHGWSPDLGYQLTKESECVYSGTLRVENVADGYGFFGFTSRLAEDPTDWDAIAPYRFGAPGDTDYTITEEMSGATIDLVTSDYQAFRAPAGEYKFTVNTSAMTFVPEIISLDPVQEYPVYILGNVDGIGWFPNVGKKMDFDGVNYTANVTVDNANEGYGYFGFTTLLGEDPEDWDAIAGFRFGAERTGEGDHLVSEEDLDMPLALTKQDYVAFQIAAGDYTFTINAERNTIVISKGAPSPITNFYILGNTDNEGWAPNRGVEMTTSDGVLFTAENVNFTPEYESEYSYFSFTSRLSEDPTDWDAIKNDRYCADGADDVLIDESNMFTNLSIVPYSYGQKSFKITPGFYNVTVNTQLLWVNVTPGAGVDAVNSDLQVVSTEYVNTLGVVANRPFDGLNIKISRMSDGTTRATKIVHTAK